MISHAYKGQLVRGVTLEELRAFLVSIVLRPERTNQFFRWLRSLLHSRNKPAGPAVITRHEPRPAPKSNSSK
jgi:hypothetical protein